MFVCWPECFLTEFARLCPDSCCAQGQIRLPGASWLLTYIPYDEKNIFFYGVSSRRLFKSVLNWLTWITVMVNHLPWKQTEITLSFTATSDKSCIWGSLLPMRASISFPKCPTVVDIVIIYKLNVPIPVHASSLVPQILICSLAISCWWTSNLPWLVDLYIPGFLTVSHFAYHQPHPHHYRSLNYQILLSLPDISISERHFHFGPASLFFLELLVISILFPNSYWTTSNLGTHLPVLCPRPFDAVCGALQVRLLESMPPLSPVECILLGFLTTAHMSLLAPHGLAHSFTAFCKPLLQKGCDPWTSLVA